ncbi:fimbrial biogenesis outer membrane usher protein, partial [Escherichia coli]
TGVVTVPEKYTTGIYKATMDCR